MNVFTKPNFNNVYHNKNVTDITSIVNFLEEKNTSLNTGGFNNFHNLNISEQLNLFVLWLNTTLYSYINTINKGDLRRLHEDLKKVRKSITDIITQTRSRLKIKRTTENVLQCSLCNYTLCMSHDYNFWDTIMSHKHFEEQIVSASEKNNKENLERSCIIQIEEPEVQIMEYQPDIRNYPPDIKYNFRFNFNIPQYYPVAMPPVYAVYPVIPNYIQPIRPLFITPNVSRINYPSKIVQQNKIVNKPQVSDYSQAVKDFLYPKDIMKKNDLYILQIRNSRCICLLCIVQFETAKNTMKEHLSGKRHIKLAENVMNIDALVQYHKFWKEQSEEDQMEQLHFDPLSKNYITCVPCKIPIPFDTILEHLSVSQHISKCKKDNETKITNSRRYLNNDTNDISDSMSDSTNSDSPTGNLPPKESSNEKPHVLKKSITENVGFFDNLENRFRQHLVHLKEKPTVIACKCCNKEVPKTIECVKEHILHGSHMTLSEISNFKRYYNCNLCNIHFLHEKRWMSHLKSVPHKDNLQKLDTAVKEKYAEFECNCGTVEFGKEDNIKCHKRSYQKKIEPFKLNNKIKEILKSEESIKIEQTNLLKESNELLLLEDNMTKCCQGIENALKEFYVYCKAYPFGSRVTGLGNPKSDLDVFVDVGGMYNGTIAQDSTAQKKILKKVRDIFYKKRSIFADINCIPTARTPIIQVFHMPSDIDCDLSFKNGLSVENTQFLKLCIDLQENTRPLILFLKKWSALQNLNTNITTYALSMMVVFYLQSNFHLLPVNILKEMNRPSQLIQEWEAIEYTMSLKEMKEHVQENTLSIKENLKGLFEFYANFNFKTDVICPLLGKPVRKIDFIHPPDGTSLPIEMDLYKKKLFSPTAEIFRATSEMCVQDPFDLSHNLTKACPESVVIKFKALCDLTAKQIN